MKFLRPYASAEDEDMKMDLLCPQLAKLTISDKEKLQLFGDTLINDMLVPMVSQGSHGEAKLRIVSKSLLDVWTQDLAGDVAEVFLNILADLSTCCRAILGVLESDPLLMLESLDAVDEVRREFRTVGSRPLCVMATSMADSAHWHGLFEKYLASTLGLKTHGGKLDEIRRFIASFEMPADDCVPAFSKTLESIVRDVGELGHQVKHESLMSLKQQVLECLRLFWHWLVPKLPANQLWPVSGEVLNQLIMEASISLGSEAFVGEMQEDMAKLALACTGKQRLTVFMEKLTEVESKVGEQFDDSMQELWEALSSSAEGCKGVAMDAAEEGAVANIMEKLISAVPPLLEKDFEHAEQFYQQVVQSTLSVAKPAKWKVPINRMGFIDVLASLLAELCREGWQPGQPG